MNPKLIEFQRKQYQARFQAYGDSVLSTFQNNKETQALRFERLLKHILPQPGAFSIHDVGSGLCDLHRYLIEQGIPHEYSGTEIVPEMIDVSKKKFPEIRIWNRDFAEAPPHEKYDLVVLSGTLNLLAGLDPQEWKEYARALLIRMFERARCGIAFNFLTTYKTFEAAKLCYFDPLDLFDFCQTKLSRFVMLDHAYPLYEATITVFRSSYIKSWYPDEAFEKYFHSAPPPQHES